MPRSSEELPTLTARDAPLDDLKSTALLVIDAQYYIMNRGSSDTPSCADSPDERYFFDRMKSVVLPNIRALQDLMRECSCEVMFTTVENLTRDGRDRSLDYKISGIFVAKGSREAQVLDEIAPLEDEIRLAKSTSSVFNSTIIEYLLRNLAIERLIIVGVLTDQCVISAVRDACDRGFRVIVPSDACATYTQQRHEWALELTKGYCRIAATTELLGELRKLRAERADQREMN